MIVAVDGNVYTGKTSLLAVAKQRGAWIIPESMPVQAPTGGGAERLQVQQAYLAQERQRLIDVREARQRGAAMIAVDRSFASLAAHVWALRVTERIDIRADFMSVLCQAVHDRQVLLPDFFVHVDVPYPTIQTRFAAGEASPKRKGTPAELVGMEYMQAIDQFHRAWRQELGGSRTLRLPAADLPGMWESVRAHLQAVPAAKPEPLLCALRAALRLRE